MHALDGVAQANAGAGRLRFAVVVSAGLAYRDRAPPAGAAEGVRAPGGWLIRTLAFAPPAGS